MQFNANETVRALLFKIVFMRLWRSGSRIVKLHVKIGTNKLFWKFLKKYRAYYSLLEYYFKVSISNLILCHFLSDTKGQLISKAIYGLLTFPKKKTDEFVSFAFLLLQQTNQIHPFGFWENLKIANLLSSFIWTLRS